MPIALPPDPLAAMRVERALRSEQRWEEAEALLAAAVAAWPNDEALLIDHGLLAQEQMHWPEMAARFAVVRARCPGHLFGHSRLGEALRWLGRFDEAEAVIGAGVPRFPDNAELLVQWVLVACDRAESGATDWRAAEARGQELIARLPDAPESYRYAAEVWLRQGKRLDGELMIAEGLHRLGPAPPLVLRFAELAAAREDWPAAARRWAAALRHLPDSVAAREGLRTAQAQVPRPPQATPVAAPAPSVPAVPEDPQRLLLDFEPLGEDITFGLVQRAAGLEPLGLLRFAVIGLDALIAALDGDFAGIGAPQHTQLLLRDNTEYVLRDPRSGLLVHTFAGPGAAPAQEFHAGACRRLQFLARKLLDELRAPTRLFVHTSRASEPQARILLLHRALARHGNASLLFVEASGDPARVGRAEWLAPGVLRGAVGRLGPADVAQEEWLALCRSAHALWRAGPQPPERRAAVPAAAAPTMVQPIAFAPAPSFATLPTRQADDPKHLLEQFEPLGQDCEFGLVQRQHGLEPLSLLRYAALSFDSLIAALDSDFAGIGDPACTRIRVDERGEYIIDDTHHGLGLHTFRGADGVAAETVAADAARHLTFLVGRLRADLRAPAKIFLRTCEPAEPPARLLLLHRALRRHSEAATLLAVEQSDDPARIGRAEWLAPGVLRGWIARFTTLDPECGQWLALCGHAHALWRAGAPAALPGAPEPPAAPAMERATAELLDRARALTAAGERQAADVLLGDAVARAPRLPALLEAWCASVHGADWAAAADRWAVLRVRFPDEAAGWLHGSAALRALTWLEAAAAVIAEGTARFPDDVDMAAERMRVAIDRRDWKLAELLAREMPLRWPAAEASYAVTADAHLARGQADAAETVLCEGLRRLPASVALLERAGRAAAAGRDWPTAEARWRALLTAAPEREEAHRGLARALRELGRGEEAEAVLAAALAMHPAWAGVGINHAWMAMARQDFAAARDRWKALAERFPGHISVLGGLEELELAERATLTAPAQGAGAATLSTFASLGEDCEFGLVQRHFGTEPLGLLRFSAIPHDGLIAALDAGMAGVGAPENTEVIDAGTEWWVLDRRFAMNTPTWMPTDAMAKERLHATACRRLALLARKFMEDLRAGERIFVRAAPWPGEAAVRLLHAALLRHGPARLLFVADEDVPAEVGQVRLIADGLMLGRIERLGHRPGGTWDEIRYGDWLLLCEIAASMPTRRAVAA